VPDLLLPPLDEEGRGGVKDRARLESWLSRKTANRPLCCGRTFYAAGLVDEARKEATRTLAVLEPYAARGVPIIGLEPSCLFTFKDEMLALGLGEPAQRVANVAVLLEEFLASESAAGRLSLPLGPLPVKALLHGHCHQKAFGAMGAVETTLRLVPDLAVETIESSCCGMAGAFGYQAETIDTSLAMAELSLLPSVRSAATTTLIVADGTSCRHQISDGANRKPLHVAQVLAMSLNSARGRFSAGTPSRTESSPT
jgi:Fe-S oxidoreductase